MLATRFISVGEEGGKEEEGMLATGFISVGEEGGREKGC